MLSSYVCVLSCFNHVQLFCNPMDRNPPGFSAHGIFQARILEWVAISSSSGFSRPGDGTRVSCVSCIADRLSILAWRIPWTEEPGRLHSMGSQRVGHD